MAINFSAEDTGEPCLLFMQKIVPRDLSRKQLVPRKLTGLTRTVESGVFRMLNVRTSKDLSAGGSIGHFKSTAGTLGAVVKDRKTGELMVLSNNHVLANGSTIQEARPGPEIPFCSGGARRWAPSRPDRRFAPLCPWLKPPQADCPVAAAVARRYAPANLLVRL